MECFGLQPRRRLGIHNVLPCSVLLACCLRESVINQSKHTYHSSIHNVAPPTWVTLAPCLENPRRYFAHSFYRELHALAQYEYLWYSKALPLLLPLVQALPVQVTTTKGHKIILGSPGNVGPETTTVTMIRSTCLVIGDVIWGGRKERRTFCTVKGSKKYCTQYLRQRYMETKNNKTIDAKKHTQTLGTQKKKQKNMVDMAKTRLG